MEQIIQVLFNNGIGACCLVYFMWYNNTTINKLVLLNNIKNPNLIYVGQKIRIK